MLTPQGLQEETRLTARFLQRKTAEYEARRAELESLRAKLGGGDADKG